VLNSFWMVVIKAFLRNREKELKAILHNIILMIALTNL